MNCEEVKGCIAELGILINDWDKIQNDQLEEIAEETIIDKAAELLEVAKPQKSEMACNCPHDCENFEDIVEEFEKANASLEDILKRMTQEEKDALTAKICTEMHFEILKLVRNAVD